MSNELVPTTDGAQDLGTEAKQWGALRAKTIFREGVEVDPANYDAAGAAATVQGNLDTHTGQTTAAHGGIVASTDPRLTDARTPTAHAASHAAAGSDAVTPSAIGAVPAAGGTMTGNLSMSGAVIQFDANLLNPTWAEGKVFYDRVEHTLAYYNDQSGVTVNIGQEMVVRGINKTGAPLLNGGVVRISGAQGQRPKFVLAQADSEVNSATTLAVMTHDLADNAEGYATSFGLVHDVNTHGMTVGDALWLSATTAGGFTNVKPSAPNHAVQIGFVLDVNATSGIIFVNIDNGYELSELHDVLLTTPAAGHSLYFDGTVWRNLAAGTEGQLLQAHGAAAPSWATPSAADLSPAVILAPGSSTRNVIQPTGDFIPLVVKQLAAQTASLQEWQDSGGTTYISVSANARTLTVGNSNYTGGLTIMGLASAVGYGNGAGDGDAIQLTNAANGTAVNNGIVFRPGQQSKYGAIIRSYVASSDGSTYPYLNVLVSPDSQASTAKTSLLEVARFSAQNGTLLTNRTAAAVALTVKGASAQTANLEEWQTSAAAVVGAVDVSGNRIFPKTSGVGIKVDPAAPTFGWKDLIGAIVVDTAAANAATLDTYRGGSVREYRFGVNDKIDFRFHMPHDWVPGTYLYIHVHWSHNGTAITGTGTMSCSLAHTYAKGYDQASFSAEKTLTCADTNVTTANTPQYRHKITEVQLSNNGGTGNLLDTASLEVDGLILVNLTVDTIPTITGGATAEPFIHFVDIHYQSTQLATKQKNGPAFYT